MNRIDGHMVIRSAAEARWSGLAAAHGENVGAFRYVVGHAGVDYPEYRDEVEFFNRDRERGEIITTRTFSKFVIKGVIRVLRSNEAYHELSPHVARAMIDMWREQLNQPQSKTEAIIMPLDPIAMEPELTSLESVLPDVSIQTVV